jgi:hypothetical protein
VEEAAVWVVGCISVLVMMALVIVALYGAGRVLASLIAPSDQTARTPAEPLFIPKSQVKSKNKAAKAKRKPVTNGKVPPGMFSPHITLDDENAPCFIHGVPKQMCKKKH